MESGELGDIQGHLTSGTIGRILYKNARDGAAAFLDKRQGNKYTEYLKSLHRN
jgi:hypothetical protein